MSPTPEPRRRILTLFEALHGVIADRGARAQEPALGERVGGFVGRV